MSYIPYFCEDSPSIIPPLPPLLFIHTWNRLQFQVTKWSTACEYIFSNFFLFGWTVPLGIHMLMTPKTPENKQFGEEMDINTSFIKDSYRSSITFVKIQILNLRDCRLSMANVSEICTTPVKIIWNDSLAYVILLFCPWRLYELHVFQLSLM